MDVPTEKSLNHFTALDYGVFVGMLLLSALIGVYFGFISKKKQNNTSEYLLGSKKMGFFPVAASLIASHISASTLLALPAEIYHFGSEYIWSIASAILVRKSLSAFRSEKLINILDRLRSHSCILASILRSSSHFCISIFGTKIQSKCAFGSQSNFRPYRNHLHSCSCVGTDFQL